MNERGMKSRNRSRRRAAEKGAAVGWRRRAFLLRNRSESGEMVALVVKCRVFVLATDDSTGAQQICF